MGQAAALQGMQVLFVQVGMGSAYFNCCVKHSYSHLKCAGSVIYDV